MIDHTKGFFCQYATNPSKKCICKSRVLECAKRKECPSLDVEEIAQSVINISDYTKV